MNIKIAGNPQTVSEIELLDGRNGEPAELIGGEMEKTAVAVKIKFWNRGPIITHPNVKVADL